MVAVLRRVEERVIKLIDEGQQTAQDYSICVSNPPRHIYDLEVYRKKFSLNAKTGKKRDIVLISMAKRNGALVQALSQIRSIKRRLEHLDYSKSTLVSAGSAPANASKAADTEKKMRSKKSLTAKLGSLTKVVVDWSTGRFSATTNDPAKVSRSQAGTICST